ncbi:MAG: MIP/aquaporin family protein [Deltaproteobacteria bacterium]
MDSIGNRWHEYLMEAAELGTFMIAACVAVVIFEHPASPVRQLIESASVRRVIVGAAMGLTAIAIIYSPWGKQSGAHLNPSVTLTFFRLRRISRRDAIFYISAQFAGGAGGVLIAYLLIAEAAGNPAVRYAATVPGIYGAWAAFVAEAVISFALMTVVLVVSNMRELARYTGVCAGALVALYISVEAPISGMSMNPARSLASALFAGVGEGLWIYFTAPPLGMLLASEAYLRIFGAARVTCAKLHHQNAKRCIHCGKPSSIEEAKESGGAN